MIDVIDVVEYAREMLASNDRLTRDEVDHLFDVISGRTTNLNYIWRITNCCTHEVVMDEPT